MTPDDLALDSRPLLEAAAAYAQTHAVTLITADPGAYYFFTYHTNSGRYLNFTGLQNLTFDLAGSDLYFQGGSYVSLECDNCQNVQFLNFTLDTLQLPFTQVQVTSVDTKNNRINYTPLPNWELAADFNAIRNPAGSAEPLYAFDFRNGAVVRSTSRMSVQRPIDLAFLTIASDGSPWSNPSQLANIQPGDVIALSARAGGPTLAIRNGSSNLIKNVSVYFGSQVGVMLQSSPNTVAEQVQVIPRPGTDRLMSTNADGISAVQLGQNLTIRRCRIRRTGDDGISPNSQQLAVVTGQTGTRTVKVNRSAFSNFPDGLPVQFIDNKTGFPAATALIVSQDPPYSTATPVFGGAATIALDHDIPTLALNDPMVYADPAFRGAGLRVENNLVEDVLQARGMSLWGLLGGTIQGNVIRNPGWSGIAVIEQDSTQTWMTGPVANMTIQRNAIEQFSTAFGTAVASALGGIDIEADDLNFAPDAGSPLQTITVQNNFVSAGPYSGIRMGNVNVGSITGNLLMNVSTNPNANNPNPARIPELKQPIAIVSSSSITSTPNTIDAVTARAYVTSAISFSDQAIAPDSFAAVFGTNLAPKVDTAFTDPFPPSLDGVMVTIVDSAGVSHAAPIVFIAPTQINFLVPSDCAVGAAVVTVTSGTATTGRGAILIDSIAPALFSVNSSGAGTALGSSVLTHSDGSQVITPLTDAVDLGKPGDVATLVLYATGLRHMDPMNGVAMYFGNQREPVQYAGAQGGFYGLDQINVNVPVQLRSAGKVDLRVQVNGMSSNTVTVTIN